MTVAQKAQFIEKPHWLEILGVFGFCCRAAATRPSLSPSVPHLGASGLNLGDPCWGEYWTLMFKGSPLPVSQPVDSSHDSLISRETVVSLATGPLERLYNNSIWGFFFFFKKNDGGGSGQQVLIALYFFSSKKLKVSPTSPVASKHSRSVLSRSVVSNSWRPHGLWHSGYSGHEGSPG